jgi:nucleoside-diphosphate-sugar epimerase
MINRKGSIIVTGASGWLGQTILENLFEVLGASTFHERVISFASKDIDAKIGRTETIKLHSLSKLPKLTEENKPDLIIHAAFLTPDYARTNGREKFVQINREITELICKAAKHSPNSRIVEISSGAAEMNSGSIDDLSNLNIPDQQLYGSLKKEEEEKLSLLAPTLILRIFALSGKHIKDPKKYALGDFLLAHTKGQPIVIQSKTPVIRGYGHAGDISKLAIHWGLSEDQCPAKPVNTVNTTIELRDLAAIIAAIEPRVKVISSEENPRKTSIYTADSTRYLNLLSTYHIPPTDLQSQIDDTMKGIKLLL